MRASLPLSILSIGSGSMITPVENGRTCADEHPRSVARRAQVLRAALTPSLPVPAFAHPVLTTSALIEASGSSIVRCCRATTTGAAQKRFCVNTAATCAPSSSLATSRSVRPGFPIPACATPRLTPCTGSRDCGSGRFRLTGIGRDRHDDTRGDGLYRGKALRTGARRQTISPGSRALRPLRSNVRGSACTSCPTRRGRDHCVQSSVLPARTAAASP